MDYREFNDFELLDYIKENHEDANNILINKYKPLIISKAKQAINSCHSLGIDINDLIQEGMLGLHEAINAFDQKRDVKFFTYAKKCIDNRIISAITTAKRQKHRILNESLSFESYDDEFSLEKVIGDNRQNPENIVLNNEYEKEILIKLTTILSDYENQVFDLKRSGFSYKEIAGILDKDAKAIDNTIQRIKNKLKELIKN